MRSEPCHEIPDRDRNGWNERLLGTAASYRQYPYWNEPYRFWRFNPTYLTLGEAGDPAAYACVLTPQSLPLRLGLVQCGPVSLRPGQAVEAAALRGLIEWAERQGYAFLRFTHSEAGLLDTLKALGHTADVDSFPFYRDPRNKLIVRQLASDDETLASFQKVARYEIRAARRAGYEIDITDRPEAVADVWPMFEALARRKGFQLHARPLPTWLRAVNMAGAHNCARLYTAYLDGRKVESVLVMRYGATAEYMLGALDVERLEGRVSPSCLIHWTAMRDFYRHGCTAYNLGGPGDMKRNMVFQFKRKFHPVLEVNPPAVTLILKPRMYQFWAASVLGAFIPWRSRLRRIKARWLPKARH